MFHSSKYCDYNEETEFFAEKLDFEKDKVDKVGAEKITPLTTPESP